MAVTPYFFLFGVVGSGGEIFRQMIHYYFTKNWSHTSECGKYQFNFKRGELIDPSRIGLMLFPSLVKQGICREFDTGILELIESTMNEGEFEEARDLMVEYGDFESLSQFVIYEARMARIETLWFRFHMMAIVTTRILKNS